MIEVDRKLTMAPLAADIQSIPFNHKPSFLLIILTLSTFPVRGNRKTPRKPTTTGRVDEPFPHAIKFSKPAATCS